jgi:nitrilase
MSKVVKAAAVQISPAPYSRKGAVEKIVEKVRDATFPETVIPSYPCFCYLQPPCAMAKEHLRVLEESITIPSPETLKAGQGEAIAGLDFAEIDARRRYERRTIGADNGVRRRGDTRS